MKKTFVEKEWVTVERTDAKHIVKITPKGEELVKIIYDLIDKLGINKDDFFNLKLGRKQHRKVIQNEGETKRVEIKSNEVNEEEQNKNREGEGISIETGGNEVTTNETNGGTVNETTDIPGEIFSNEKELA